MWDKSSVVRWSWVQILIHGLLIPRQEQLSCPLPGATISRTSNGQAGSITLSVGARRSHTHKGASACLWQSLPRDLFVGPPVFCVSLLSCLFSPNPNCQATLHQNNFSHSSMEACGNRPFLSPDLSIPRASLESQPSWQPKCGRLRVSLITYSVPTLKAHECSLWVRLFERWGATMEALPCLGTSPPVRCGGSGVQDDSTKGRPPMVVGVAMAPIDPCV